jgi:tetratricopeptide (TPR) repeat protein
MGRSIKPIFSSSRFLVSFAISLFIWAGAFGQDDPEVFYQKGKDFLDNGQYIEAISELTHALSVDPGMGRAYLDRARAKKGLAEQFGFNDTELCHDLVAALHQGLLEARELMEQKCMGHCYSQKTAFLIPEDVFCADFSSSVMYELPPSLDSLRNLVKLNMYNNKLTVLHEDIGELKYLVELDLSSNKLSETHDGLSELKFLHHLNLNKNEIRTISDNFGQLENLTELFLRNNYLKEMPKSIARLKKLVKLDLALNELTDLPIEIANLVNLKQLILVGNEISPANQKKIRGLLPNCEIYFDNDHN